MRRRDGVLLVTGMIGLIALWAATFIWWWLICVWLGGIVAVLYYAALFVWPKDAAASGSAGNTDREERA